MLRAAASDCAGSNANASSENSAPRNGAWVREFIISSTPHDRFGIADDTLVQVKFLLVRVLKEFQQQRACRILCKRAPNLLIGIANDLQVLFDLGAAFRAQQR